MQYQVKDSVLPSIGFQCSPIDIRIEISEARVQLFVANRDWVWDKETGKFIGAECSGPFIVPVKSEDAPQENMENSETVKQQAKECKPGESSK